MTRLVHGAGLPPHHVPRWRRRDRVLSEAGTGAGGQLVIGDAVVGNREATDPAILVHDDGGDLASFFADGLQ